MMNSKKIIGLCSLFLLIGVACKKEETTETKGYLSGTLSFQAAKYIEKGDSLFFTPGGKIYHPENGTIIYSWQVSPGMDKSDTSARADHGFGYRFRNDTIGTFTVTCTAIPSGEYYSTSATNYITVVEEGYEGTLPLETNEKDTLWNYQGDRYAATLIGNQYWMRSNLAADKSTDGTKNIGVGYMNYEIMRGVFGAYYNWEDAMNACPSGWHLPSEQEWATMAQQVKPTSVSETPAPFATWKKVAGEMMCYYQLNGNDMIGLQAGVKITDNSRLSIKMLGYADEGKYFKMFNERACFWTSSEDGSEKAWCRYFVYSKADAYAEPMNKKGFYAQVRCIKDKS